MPLSVIPIRGSLGSSPRPLVVGVVLFVLWAVATNDQFAATLMRVMKVMRTITP
jgi:hypothetical protein